MRGMPTFVLLLIFSSAMALASGISLGVSRHSTLHGSVAKAAAIPMSCCLSAWCTLISRVLWKCIRSECHAISWHMHYSCNLLARQHCTAGVLCTINALLQPNGYPTHR